MSATITLTVEALR